MGAKTSLLLYAQREPADVLRAPPPLDHAASRALLDELYPGLAGDAAFRPESTLGDDAYPDERLVCAARFPGLDLVCNRDLQIDRPSELPKELVRAARGRTVYLHAMHSVADFFAFGVWRDGRLARALSLSPDEGVIEDIGARLPFEVAYWDGDYPVDDEYPLPFHPLELGEAALEAFFGFHLEGEMTDIDPLSVPVSAFLRRRA